MVMQTNNANIETIGSSSNLWYDLFGFVDHSSAWRSIEAVARVNQEGLLQLDTFSLW